MSDAAVSETHHTHAPAPMTPSSDDALDPTTLLDLEADYELLGELGRGGSAIVYRARDRELGREVAVKVVRPTGPMTLLQGPTPGGEVRSPSPDEPVARLAREARAVARLQHPNVVGVYAIRRLQQGGLALVMELIHGRTLKDVLEEDGPLPVERAARVLRDVAEALAYAHARGVVHRDVKPENIFIDAANDRVMLSDFGIARLEEQEMRLTQTGTTLGTPAYMAPEQIAGLAVDGRSDLYSLGLVAWEMLTGRQPWEGIGLYELLDKQRRETPPPIEAVRPPDRGPVPLPLQYAIERMLQKEPGARWPDAATALTQLDGRASPPADYPRWLEAHRRRVESHKRSAQAARRKALAVVAAPVDDGTARLAVEVAPEWVTAAERRRSRRRVGMVAGGVLLAALGGFAAWRGMTAPPRPSATRATVADARGTIEVPVGGGATRRSAAGGEASRVADSAPGAPSMVPEAPSSATPAPLPASPPLPEAEHAPAVAANPAANAAAPNASAPNAAAPNAGAAAKPNAPQVAPSAPPAPAAPAALAVDRGTIAVGGRHTCALSGAGRAFCWGANDRGQLGAGGDAGDGRAAPGPVAGDIEFVQIAAGVAHTCALTRAGDAYCWGNDEHGELGDATTSTRDAPVRVGGGFRFRMLRTGLSHTCGVTGEGTVACWGANGSGQLGDGSTAARTSPTIAAAPNERFTAVATGWRHTCALSANGAAFCWGANDDGQLGDGTHESRRTPTPVAGGLSFVSIAAGSAHTCGVTAGGEAYCWGKDTYGQLGIGATVDLATPARVNTAMRFVSVTAGSVHTCARTSSGAVACWGRNVYGQLGDGSTVDRPSPVRVPGSYQSVDATGAHTCGARADGGIDCWGYNVEGQLGDGTRTHRASPVRVSRSLP